MHSNLGLGQGCQGTTVLYPDTLYETTLKANRRTAACDELSRVEYRISNVEGWVRFAQSFY
jgi:hypothetical protein